MATTKKITPFKLKPHNGQHSGKSTVDGSYVKGIYTNVKGGHFVNGIPVHPWSVGIIVSKVEYNQSS